jgi:hypothetical protein
MKSFAHLLVKFSSRSKSPAASLFAAALIFSFALMPSASADVLELKTGEIVQGKFVSASSATIRFEVNGQAQTFAIKDVLNVGFSDASDAAPSPTPPPPSPVSPPQPDPNAAAPPQQQQPPPAPADSDPQADNPPAAPPPPQQTALYNGPTQAVTIPAGTTVVIRMIDSVDSQTNHVSDPFHASLDAPLVVGSTVVAQKGADVYGMLANAKDSGHISGAPQLTLELTGIRINGNVVPIDSTTYDVVGKSRGSQSAERIGGGAIAGAVLGGIIAGPKGAAVGATLGAGGGTAVQLSTHGDRIRVPSETRLEFTTENDVTALTPAASN